MKEDVDEYGRWQAVNSLLVALDRLGRYPNIIVLCTSNLVDAIVSSLRQVNLIWLTWFKDSAFLDRIDVKQYIPQPNARARYEILRRCYLDLLSCKMIVPLQATRGNGDDRPEGPAEYVSVINGQIVARAEGECFEVLPAYDITQLHFLTDQCSTPYKLSKIADSSAVSSH